MATEQPVILDSTKNAYVSLATKQFYFVKETTNGIELCSGATDLPCGVLQNAPGAGEPAQVMRLGISKVVAGGVVAVGALLGTDGNGKAAAKVPGTDTTNYVAGKNIGDVAGADNRIITAAINCMNPHRAA